MRNAFALACVVGGLASCGPATHVTTATPTPPPSEAGSVTHLPLRVLDEAAAEAEIWRPQLRPAWRAPTADEARALSDLVVALMAAARGTGSLTETQALADHAGMRIERWEVKGRQHLIAIEPPDARHGMGAYLFALDAPPLPTPWLLWQAPHAYHDVNSGRVAAQLYFGTTGANAPRVFFTNTLHRYTQSDGRRAKAKVNPADACHNADHPFNLATQAVAAAYPGATVVQLHGFAAGADPDDDAPRLPEGTRVVVSAGRKDGPDALSTAAASELARLLGAGVRLFPSEVGALGATTNVEMRGLAAAPSARFLHLEMSAEVRSALAGDVTLREAFGQRIFALAASSTPPIPGTP